MLERLIGYGIVWGVLLVGGYVFHSRKFEEGVLTSRSVWYLYSRVVSFLVLGFILVPHNNGISSEGYGILGEVGILQGVVSLIVAFILGFIWLYILRLRLRWGAISKDKDYLGLLEDTVVSDYSLVYLQVMVSLSIGVTLGVGVWFLGGIISAKLKIILFVVSLCVVWFCSILRRDVNESLNEYLQEKEYVNVGRMSDDETLRELSKFRENVYYSSKRKNR